MSRGVLLLSLALLSCNRARGEGQVESDALSVPGCTDGPYQMDPNFFGSSPYENTQTIRVQRGNNPSINADGLLVVVHDVDAVRDALDAPIEVRLPGESFPADVPPPFFPDPLVTMSLHLGGTCAEEVVSLSALSGTVTFSELHNGEPTAKKKDRLIAAEFDVMMGDPRELVPDEDDELGVSSSHASRVTGSFRFYYRKGQPAQTFP